MRTVLRGLVASASALAFVATVAAAQATKPAKPAASGAKTTAAPKAAASKSATGKISKYDSATKTLTISTTKGDESFTLSDKAVVHSGPKSITADDLGTMTGQSAKVRYKEAGGAKTAEMVTVSNATAKASKPKKSGKD